VKDEYEIKELRELVRWAQHHIPRDVPNCLEFLNRAYNILGEEFASSGSPSHISKIVQRGSICDVIIANLSCKMPIYEYYEVDGISYYLFIHRESFGPIAIWKKGNSITLLPNEEMATKEDLITGLDYGHLDSFEQDMLCKIKSGERIVLGQWWIDNAQ
jgi:hypothetical protein